MNLLCILIPGVQMAKGKERKKLNETSFTEHKPQA